MPEVLAEHESKRLLAEYDVPFAPERVAATPEAAADAADALGYPCAVKLSGAGITHKTERGLVRLGLGTAHDVKSAAMALLGAAHPEDGDVQLLVAPMISGSRELIAGLLRDPQFGPCVLVGMGGVLAEAIGDVSVRIAPIDDFDARDMLDDLTSQLALGPVRGEPALDRGAMGRVLLGLSRLASERPDVWSVDVNPLVVSDGLPIAVDALVELDGSPA
jgi:acetate---CoA ligase (ADP-forming) subunit beta